MSEDIYQYMETILGELQELRQEFDTKVKYDGSKNRLIDTLHQELQGYKEGIHTRLLRPIFMDLITMQIRTISYEFLTNSRNSLISTAI